VRDDFDHGTHVSGIAAAATAVLEGVTVHTIDVFETESGLPMGLEITIADANTAAGEYVGLKDFTDDPWVRSFAYAEPESSAVSGFAAFANPLGVLIDPSFIEDDWANVSGSGAVCATAATEVTGLNITGATKSFAYVFHLPAFVPGYQCLADVNNDILVVHLETNTNQYSIYMFAPSTADSMVANRDVLIAAFNKLDVTLR
jgi:hypothetical protein